MVTGKYITRNVRELVCVTVQSERGRRATLTGTPVHPMWSPQRQAWVPLGDLQPGDFLQTRHGPATVVHSERETHPEPVYNLEIHGQHVYEVSDLGILTHNTTLPGGVPGGPCPGSVAPNKGGAEWKSWRSFQDGDTGLKDHARRHSDLSPPEYLAKGQLNVSHGKRLKGGGKYPDVNYWIRKTGEDQYSLTSIDRNGKVLSIDTWQHGGVPMTKADILKGLEKSGVTPPKGFWESL